MFTYWLQALRAVSAHAAALGVLIGGTLATFALLDTPGDGAEAGSLAATGLLAGCLGFAVLISSAEALSAFRVARRHGDAPTGEMMRYPCVREVRLRRQGDQSASATADEALRCLREADGMRLKRVVEAEGGVSVSASDTRVAALMHVLADGPEVVIRLETRPAWRWKKLDGGASWGVAQAWEARVRTALRPSSPVN